MKKDKYLKIFLKLSEYDSYLNDDNFIMPNVSYCNDNKKTYYSPYYSPFNEQYLTLESLEDDNQISFTNNLTYSINCSTWKTLLSNEKLTFNKRDVVRFKSNLTSNSAIGIGTFNVSKKYNVYGNIMSLLYGDEFIDKYSLSGNSYTFRYLFQSSTTLVNANNLILPATTLEYECYASMFSGCTSLVTAPELPAMELSVGCYERMFYNCNSLVISPELPATTLSEGCYKQMFKGCSNLNYIKMLATDINASYCLSDWVLGVSRTGIFTMNPDATWEVRGSSGIPNGWTINRDYESHYFTIMSLEDENEISFTNNLQYSLNDGDWTNYTSGSVITMNTNDYIHFKGNLIPNSTNGIGTFSSTGSYNVYGNIMSLLYGDEFEGKYSLNNQSYAFCNLFKKSTTLINAANLILPATTLATYCYRYMFQDCTSLTTAPELSATTIANYCYANMFDGCTSLTSAPELPATTLASHCYQFMFQGCSSLTTAPELSATTLENYCYASMFRDCTSLATAPELPATTLVTSCYEYMFNGCTNLNNIKTYTKTNITSTNASSYTNSWVYNVANTGTFVKYFDTDIIVGSSGIPSGWSVTNI